MEEKVSGCFFWTQCTCKLMYVVGSRVIVLLLSFFEYFVQLAYSCTHLFSDTGHLLSTALPSSRARTVDAWEVRGQMRFILQTWHEKYDQLNVYWWSAAGSWFLFNEMFQSSWRTGTLLLTAVLPFYCTNVAFAGAFSTSWPSTHRTWHWPTGVWHHVVVTVAITALFLAVNPRRGSRQRRQPTRTSPFSVSQTSAELLLLPRCRPTVFCLPF